MTNRSIIEKKLNNVGGYTIGCWSKLMDKITKTELMKVINNIDLEYTDIDIIIGKKQYVVELATVDNEKDFSVLSREEYIDRYGNERYEKD